MNSRFHALLLLAGFLLLGGASLQAKMSDYTFIVGTGTPTNMTGSIQVMAANQDEARVGPNSLGFTFNFDGTDYTTYNLSSNGWLKFGAAATSADLSNAFDASAQYPLIAPFWDDLRTYPDSSLGNGNVGYIRYLMAGTAPNRVVTFEFLMKFWTGAGNGPWKYQLRLYETSNRIEIVFLSMPQNYATSATIGAGTSVTNFVSVTPGSPATVSYTVSNNAINLNNTQIPPNTMYTFVQCQPTIEIVGNVAQGGTSTMASGDVLLDGQQSAIGEGISLTPLTISNGLSRTACATRSFTYTVSGPNASEYVVTPGSGTLLNGASNTPTLTFSPKGLGQRTATLTVIGDGGFNRSYTLRGEGIPRISWIGNALDGGTDGIASGDLLLQGVEVRRTTSRDFRPMTIANGGKSRTAAPAIVTFSLNDPAGQYRLSTTAVALAAGESITPVLTFAPTGVGEQKATLVVNADGEIRTYLLDGYSLAPAAEFTLGGAAAYSGQNYFNRTTICVGEAEVVPVTIRNINRMDVVLDDVAIYATENEPGKGGSRYAIRRDARGDRLRSGEYAVTEVPGTASPKLNRPVSLPLVIAPGETRTLYLNYLPARPGNRYGRLFLRTNGENFSGPALGSFDPGAVPSAADGLFVVDLHGKSLGAVLAGASTAGRPSAITFQPVDVRKQTTSSTIVENSGACDLKISRAELSLVSGDVNDFALLSVLPNTPVVGGYYVLAAGMRDSIVASFAPQTFGSRRASLRLVTNDSTIGAEGLATPNDFYVDLFGRGLVGIEVPDMTVNPAVIGAESSRGVIRLINTKGAVIQITDVKLIDPSGEFLADPAKPWPAMPIAILPGAEVELGVMLAPGVTSAPGTRQATVRVTQKDGDPVTATIRGYAGTRTLAIAPNALFTTRRVPVGEVVRALVGITNTGTLPVRLNQPVLSGANPGDYMVGRLGRTVIEPGGTELIEISYAPTIPGLSSATLNFGSNSTGGSLLLQLGGEGMANGIHPSESASPNGSGASPGASADRSVASAEARAGLGTIAPNPVGDHFTLEIALPSDAPAELFLYGADGRMARQVALDRTRGVISVSTEGLPTGTYRLVVKQRQTLHTSTVMIVR